jgi:diguanylate cyclase (GGDEF)-like protein
MPITLSRRWTLKRQLNLFFTLTLLAVLFSSVFAVFRIKDFDDRRALLLASSKQLQNGLNNNFANTRAIGVMRTHLRMYMNSGDSEKMLLVHGDVKLLKKSLGPAYQDDIGRFYEMLKVLDVRMRSLRNNSLTTSQAESDIMAIGSRLLHLVGPEYLFIIQKINAKTCLHHHRFYGQLTDLGQADKIEAALREEGEHFAEVDRKLQGLEKIFPPEIQTIIHELRDAYYELDESVTTIGSIRIHTLRTQSEVMQILATLETLIAADSLQQNEASRTLMADSLILARKNITLMYVSLILTGIFFALIALLLNHGMISPLVRFVKLLQNVTQLLTGLRTREVRGDEDFSQLVRMANTQHNEIGEVARSIENLVRRLRDLALFRHAIENDETSGEIMRRLGNVFSEKIGLDAFVIYERKQDKPGMEIICVQPESLRENVPDMKEKSQCRAWRTGAMVSSIESPDICDRNPAPGKMEHICIPMRSGTHVMGVVQILTPVGIDRRDDPSLTETLEEVKHYIAETLPILQSQQLAGKLECMATEDPLTGLFNRRYLELSLDRLSAVAQRRNSHVGILMCDVDFFKSVNDEYGHDAGDEVLRQLSKILTKYTREMDLVVRFGGEEFLILLIDCKKKEATAMGERIREAVEAYAFRIPSCTLHKTISIGVADFTGNDGQEIRDVIKEADSALYQAKKNGRNRVV